MPQEGTEGDFKSPIALLAEDVFKMIDFPCRGREFTQLIFLSCLFPRESSPPEALALRRAFRGDPIGQPVRQNEKGLIWVRTFEGVGALVIKLTWRKNFVRGCILKRIRLCSSKKPGAKAACPPVGLGR